MATGIITNRITDPSGTALVSVTVNARLKPGPGFRPAATYYEVAALKSTTTDSNGDWSLTLEINTDITPAGSYYEVEEKIPDANGGPRVYAVQVAAGSATLYASLINTPPAVANANYITLSQADARYLAVTGGVGIGSIQAVGTSTVTGTATTAAAANHIHPLNPSIAGSGLALSTGVLSAANLTNSNVATSFLHTITSTNTTTATVAAGQFQYSSASAAVFVFTNARVNVTPQGATVGTSETTTNVAYVDLATSGPAVTLFTGTSALVMLSCTTANSTATALNYMSVAVSGATTTAAADGNSQVMNCTSSGAAYPLSRTFKITGLTAGVNTFTAKYKVNAGTGTFYNRDITVTGLL